MPPGQMVIHRSGLRSFPEDGWEKGTEERTFASVAHCAKHASNWFRGDEKKSVTYTHDDAMGRLPPDGCHAAESFLPSIPLFRCVTLSR